MATLTPIHDWTRVDSGTYHDFHQSWTLTLRNALNNGVLPDGCFAMVEQRIGGPIADVLALELAKSANGDSETTEGGLAVAVAPPRAQLTLRTDAQVYAGRANRVTVRHRHGKIIAVVEIVSPGNKHSTGEFRTFVEKSGDLIRQGIHLLVVDLFPPTPRDPSGMAKAIWDEFDLSPVDLPVGQPLTICSVDAANHEMYVNFVGVGETLPSAALFIAAGRYVPAPLAESYEEAWRTFPAPLKRLVQ